MSKARKLSNADLEMLKGIAMDDLQRLEAAIIAGANMNLWVSEEFMEKIKREEYRIFDSFLPVAIEIIDRIKMKSREKNKPD